MRRLHLQTEAEVAQNLQYRPDLLRSPGLHCKLCVRLQRSSTLQEMIHIRALERQLKLLCMKQYPENVRDKAPAALGRFKGTSTGCLG